MIELFQIFFAFAIFFIISLVPLNVFNENKNIQNKIFFPVYNIIINFNILLIISFFKLDINFYGYIILFLYIFLFFLIYSRNKLIEKNFKLDTFILFFIFIILSLDISSNLSLSWDARLFYLPKAILFFEGGSIKDLHEVSGYEWHPHLFSYIWAFYWKISFLKLEYFGRLIFLFFYLLSLVTLLNYFKFKKRIKILILTFLIYTNYQYKNFSGGSEILIISLLIVCSIIIYEIYSKKKYYQISNLIFLSLIFNLLLWTKTEGLIYITFIIFLIFLSKVKISKKFYLMISVFFIIIIKISLYKFYNLEINPRKEIYEIKFLSKLSIYNALHTILIVTKYLIFYTLKNYYILFSLLSIFFIKNKLSSKFLKIYLFLNFILIYLIYLTYTFDVQFYVSSTLERVILSINGFAIIAQIIFIKQIIKKLNS